MANTDLAREAKLVGSQIRQVRKRARLSIQNLAERAGYTAEFMSQIEKGERQPAFETIVRLAKALGVSPAIFFTRHANRPMVKDLRRQIRGLLERCSSQQLLHTSAVLN